MRITTLCLWGKLCRVCAAWSAYGRSCACCCPALLWLPLPPGRITAMCRAGFTITVPAVTTSVNGARRCLRQPGPRGLPDTGPAEFAAADWADFPASPGVPNDAAVNRVCGRGLFLLRETVPAALTTGAPSSNLPEWQRKSHAARKRACRITAAAGVSPPGPGRFTRTATLEESPHGYENSAPTGARTHERGLPRLSPMRRQGLCR